MHFLAYLHHEDEADHLGVSFKEVDGNLMEVSIVVTAEEYEVKPQVMEKAKARKVWSELLNSGNYARGDSR